MNSTLLQTARKRIKTSVSFIYFVVYVMKFFWRICVNRNRMPRTFDRYSIHCEIPIHGESDEQQKWSSLECGVFPNWIFEPQWKNLITFYILDRSISLTNFRLSRSGMRSKSSPSTQYQTIPQYISFKQNLFKLPSKFQINVNNIRRSKCF